MANKYLRKYDTPSAAFETLLYSVPTGNTAILSSLRITNGNASSSTTLDVRIYPEGGATYYAVLEGYSLPVDGTMDVFNGVPCVMNASDELRIISSATDVDFYLSYLEVDRN